MTDHLHQYRTQRDRLACSCGHTVSTDAADSDGNVWGTPRDDDGNPPKVGTRLPDGTYVAGRLASGSYASEDGTVLD